MTQLPCNIEYYKYTHSHSIITQKHTHPAHKMANMRILTDQRKANNKSLSADEPSEETPSN